MPGEDTSHPQENKSDMTLSKTVHKTSHVMEMAIPNTHNTYNADKAKVHKPCHGIGSSMEIRESGHSSSTCVISRALYNSLQT